MKKLYTEMFLCDINHLDSQYQKWLDENNKIEIVSTALTYTKEKFLVLVVTYKDSKYKK